jgi:hypothetical protein
VCFEYVLSDRKSGAPQNDVVEIRFPAGQAPSLTHHVAGTIVEWRLEGITFSTGGHQAAGWVLDELKQKYGEPASLTPRQVGNLYGATFEAFTARWITERLTVTFESVTTRINHGSVRIYTKKGAEYSRREIDRVLKPTRPL